MNISDLLGAVVQSGLAPSSGERLRNAMGGGSGNPLESLAGMLGGQPGSRQGGGLGDLLSGMLGGGGAGGVLGNVLKEAGRAAGGNQNLALGGLGALAGAILGGGGKSMGGAMGGGVMALLAAMAFQALKGSGAQQPPVPLGLLEPQTRADRQELERHAEIVFKAMINAAKADGQIDQEEIRRIVGKLQEVGVDPESQQYVMTEMQKPMETQKLVSAAGGKPEIAAQVYAASLLAIEVDTPEEEKYLAQLAAGLGLGPEITQRIQTMVGLQRA
ncbi:MAG: tellurite resistance TerB family protein [Desulfobacterales bacterium]|jgi:uncharacterized membrane protein YebE (DUF533 family)|nr:tellurite resistance TerB family protein [Desulfobacterales bacterium]